MQSECFFPPIKFGGSPTDISNKIILTRPQHIEFTKYWNRLMFLMNKK